MKNKMLFIFLALFAVGGINLYADDSITLARARELALTRSKTVQQALLSVDSALLDEKAQDYELLPKASLSVGGGLKYPAASGTTLADNASVSASLSVSQTIYDGGKNAILKAIDLLATRSAREEARAAYLDVLESTDSAYYAVLEAQAAVEAAGSDLDASKAHQSIAQAKYEAGIVIKSAMIEAQAETASKETALGQTRKTLAVAKATLKSITGVSSTPQAIVFSDYDAIMKALMTFDDAATESTIKKLLASASANNPSLAVSALAANQAESEIAAAKTGYLPNLSAGWSHEASYSAVDGLDLASNGSLTLTLSIPLDAYSTKNAVQSKTIAAKKASLTADADIEALSLKIQSAAYDLTSSVHSVSSSQKALEYAESNYEVKLELFKLSKASSSELSDAELLVSSSRSSLISARYTFLGSLSTLGNLAGLDSEALLLSMLK